MAVETLTRSTRSAPRPAASAGTSSGERIGGMRLGSFSPTHRSSAESGGSHRPVTAARLAGMSAFSPGATERATPISTRIIMPRAESTKREHTAPPAGRKKSSMPITRRITQVPERFKQGDKTLLFGAFPPPAERAGLEQQAKNNAQPKKGTIPLTIIPRTAEEAQKPRNKTLSITPEQKAQVLFKRMPEGIHAPKIAEAVKAKGQPGSLPKASATPTTEQKLAAVRTELARMQILTNPVTYETTVTGKPARTPKVETRHTEQTKPAVEERTQHTLEQIAAQPHAEALPRTTVEPTAKQQLATIRTKLAQSVASTQPNYKMTVARQVDASPKAQAETQAKAKPEMKQKKKKIIKTRLAALAKKTKTRYFVRDERADAARVATVTAAAEKELTQKVGQRRMPEISGHVLSSSLSPDFQDTKLQSEIVQPFWVQLIKGAGADGSLPKIADQLRATRPFRKMEQVAAQITSLVRLIPAVRISEDSGNEVSDQDVATVVGKVPNLHQKE